MKRFFLIAGIIVAVASVTLVSAQEPQPPQGPNPQGQMRQPQPPDDPLADTMFPPDMIMQHQRELGLTDEQKTFMRTEINRAMTRFNELQWQEQDLMEALHATMKAPQINEQQAMAQLDRVLDTEREIKRLHFGLNIAIKNKLTSEQQMKLQSMRNVMAGPRMDGPRMGPDGPGRGPGPPGRGPGGPGGPGSRPGGPGPARPGGPPNF